MGSSEPTGEKNEGVGTVYLESGFSYETIRDLMRKGHKVGYQPSSYYGGYQSIRVDTRSKVYFGASESRKDGMAAGW